MSNLVEGGGGKGGVGVTPSFSPSSVSNQTSNANDSTLRCDQVDASAQVFFMVIHSLVFLVGLILNGFTLKVYFCRAQRRPSGVLTIYLKNLAAADFLMSLCIPMRIMSHTSNSVSVRQVFCNFGTSTFYLNMYASILFMGYIAANRYLKIVHPLGTHILQTGRAAHIISTVTWVFLLAMMSAYVTLSLLTQEELHSVPNTATCEDLHSKQLGLFSKITHTFSTAIFFIVLVSLVFFYYSTSRRLSLAQQKQPASSCNKKLVKSRRNILVLVSVFCICFVPYHLVRLPYEFMNKQCSGSQVFFYLKKVTIMLWVLNLCLDPLIYFIFCKAYRAQLSLRRVTSSRQIARTEETPGGGAANNRHQHP
ncbi:P2Y purinoceptor 14-like [Symphorus nematophorus]